MRDLAGSGGAAGSGAAELADAGGDEDDDDGGEVAVDGDGVAAGFEPPEHAVAATSTAARMTTKRIRSR
jgi:hypothetical protein